MNGIHEVTGSIPVWSTNLQPAGGLRFTLNTLTLKCTTVTRSPAARLCVLVHFPLTRGGNVRRRQIPIALLLVSAVGLVSSVGVGAAHAQAPPTSSGQAAFEVASIKRNTQPGVATTLRVDPGGRLHIVGAPLFWLIAGAYGDAKGGLRPEQVVGGPSWLQSERYDISAQTPDADPTGGSATFITMRPFLQSLLEDRFQLKVRRETRELPIYALVRSGKNGALGPGFSHSTIDCTNDASKCGFRGGPVGRIKADALTSDLLMQLLANASGRIVVDRTDLEGPFAIDLEWSQDQSASDKPSLFTAVREQLGLKLESTRGPVDVLVIDHVERPTQD